MGSRRHDLNDQKSGVPSNYQFPFGVMVIISEALDVSILLEICKASGHDPGIPLLILKCTS